VRADAEALIRGVVGDRQPVLCRGGMMASATTAAAGRVRIAGSEPLHPLVAGLRRYQVGTRPQRPQSRPHVPAGGVLKLGPFEIAQLDNDPSFPERGRLTLDLRGGR